jgi:tungstate transport system permease protein
VEPFFKALQLMAAGDTEIWWTIGNSMRLAFLSILCAVPPGVVLGTALSMGRFRGKKALVAAVNAVMALPTVTVGLFVYSFISRSGPLGDFGLLFTPGGVVIGQAVLALPLVVAMTYTGLCRLDPRYVETLTTLGAGPLRRVAGVLKEGRYIVLQACLAAFGRVVGEVGVSMMLGGNIRWYTRTMTTTIALDASKGEFERALAFGLALLAIALTVNALSHLAVRHES